MSEPEVVTLPGGKIQFYDYYLPRLQAGKYQITVQQRIDQDQEDYFDYKLEGQVYETVRTFHVAAPRFRLGPSDVHAVFPPGNSQGNFDQTLPHVVLRRRTLPWERQLRENSDGDATVRPWLALLLFHASDSDGTGPPPRLLRSLSEIIIPVEQDVIGPSLESDWDIDDPEGKGTAHTIDVPAELFARIAPSLEELPLLAHVRQVNTGDKELLGLLDDGWFSVVIGNRLPKAGELNTAHLVSLEGWHKQLPDQGQTANGKKLRLVSLASWSFEAKVARGSFKELMEELDIGLLRVPLPAGLDQRQEPAAKLVSQAVKSGYVPLNYETRLGERTAGWYRGPLLPVHVKRVDIDPYESTEAALVYDPRTGLFDASYAVAWQIGRLLALSDSHFAAGLQAWRQAGHQLLDLILDRLQVAARFDEVGLFALPERDEPELLTQLWEEVRNPKLMSDRLTNHVLKGLLIKGLILPDEQVTALKAAPVDKNSLTAGLKPLTQPQIDEIQKLPVKDRPERIRQMLEGVS